MRAARWITGIAIALLITTVALVTLGSSSDSISCPSFPGCLASPGSLVGLIHISAAGVLALLLIALVALSGGAASRPYRSLWPAVGALLALLVAATFGSLFATGAVPNSFAPLQYLWLGITLVLLVGVAGRLRKDVAGASAKDA